MAVVRVRSGGFDDNGDPIEGPPRRLEICDAKVAPRSSSDVNDRGRAGVIVGLSLFARYGTDIVHGDVIEVDGVPYNVEGETGQWKNPFTGWNAGSEIALTRARG